VEEVIEVLITVTMTKVAGVAKDSVKSKIGLIWQTKDLVKIDLMMVFDLL